MNNIFASVGGIESQSLRIEANNLGPWHVHANLIDDLPLSGATVVRVGELELRGTVRNWGSFVGNGDVLVVGGGDGWHKIVEPRHYHSDAGVRAKLVVEHLATDVGETIGEFHTYRERLGTHFVRGREIAAKVLHDICDTNWWVGFDGLTHVGDREGEVVDSGLYTVLRYEPAWRSVELAMDDLRSVAVGSILDDGVIPRMRIRELIITVKDSKVRVRVLGVEL